MLAWLATRNSLARAHEAESLGAALRKTDRHEKLSFAIPLCSNIPKLLS